MFRLLTNAFAPEKRRESKLVIELQKPCAPRVSDLPSASPAFQGESRVPQEKPGSAREEGEETGSGDEFRRGATGGLRQREGRDLRRADTRASGPWGELRKPAAPTRAARPAGGGSSRTRLGFRRERRRRSAEAQPARNV